MVTRVPGLFSQPAISLWSYRGKLIGYKNISVYMRLRHQFFLFQKDWQHFDGSVQERRNSIANALELHLSCTNPSIYEPLPPICTCRLGNEWVPDTEGAYFWYFRGRVPDDGAMRELFTDDIVPFGICIWLPRGLRVRVLFGVFSTDPVGVGSWMWTGGLWYSRFPLRRADRHPE